MQKQKLKSSPSRRHVPLRICLYTDSQGKILKASDSIVHFTGKTSQEIKGISLTEIVNAATRKKLLLLLENGLHSSGLPTDFQIKFSPGTIPLRFNVAAIATKKNGHKTYKWHSAQQPLTESIEEKNLLSKRTKEKDGDLQSESYEELKEILENTAEVIFKFDDSGRILYASPELERKFEYLPEEILGNPLQNFIHPDDRVLYEKAVKKLLQTHLPVRDIVFRLKKRDGQYRWLNTSAKYIFNKEGIPKYGVALSVDITDQKGNLEKLQASEQRYTAFLQNSSEGIWRIEIPGAVSIKLPFEAMLEYVANHGYLAECNKVFANMYGYEDPAQMIGCRLGEMMPIDDATNIAYLTAFVDSGFNLSNAESMELTKDGEKKYFLNNLIGIIENEKLLRLWGTQRDVTELRNAEEAMKQSEERYRVFIQQSSEGIWRMEGIPNNLSEYTEDTLIDEMYSCVTVKECNDVFAKTYGYQYAHEMIGKPLQMFLPRERPENIDFLKKFIRAGFRLEDIEAKRTDGNGLPLFTMNNLLGIVENDRLTRVWGTQRNVSKLKAVEKEVDLQEKQYKTLAENVPVLIHRLDRDLRFTYVNQAVKNTFNLPPDGFIGKTPFELGLDKTKWEKLRLMAEKIFLNGKAQNITIKIPSKTDTTKEYNLLLNLAPEINENGRVHSLIAIANEISPLIKVQEELVYKDQLLSVIAEVTNEFLRKEDSKATITKAIKSLGQVFAVDRVSILENRHTNNNEETLVRTFLWNNPSKGYPSKEMEFPEIPTVLLRNILKDPSSNTATGILTADLEENDFKKFLKENSIRSQLIVPIEVHQECWGFIVCSVKGYERNWLDVEKGMLETFTTSLASALEREHVEQMVQESESRFRHMADNAPVMIWVSDQEDKVIYVNESFRDFTGLDADEVNDRKWASLVHPDDYTLAVVQYETKFPLHEPVLIEYRILSKFGDYRWIIDEAIPRFLPDGSFLGYIGSIVDIHDRKLIEEKMRFQARVMQEVSEAIVAVDLNNNVIIWNKGAETIYGYAAKEILGQPIATFINMVFINDSLESSLEHLNKYGTWSGEMYFDRKDGKRIYIHSSVTFLTDEKGNRIGFVGNNRDITDRRKSEEALRISEERYRSVVNAMGEGIMLHDREGAVIASNKSAESILGIRESKDKDKSSFVYNIVAIHEDGSPLPPEQYPFKITLQTGKSLKGIVMGVYGENSTLTWITVNTEPIYYSNQRIKPDAVVASFVDITQRKTAEIELQQNEKQLREFSERINNILNSITDGFIAVDNDMKVFLWNRVFEKATGIRSLDVIGKKITEIFPELPKAVIEQFSVALIEKKTLFKESYSSLYKLWFEISAFPSSQGLFIYFRDISRRKRQEMLVALEKETLELNARQQSSLKSTIDFLLSGLEKAFPGMLCSVLTKQEDVNKLEVLSAPTLPESYMETCNGLEIGPNRGSCGTAMYLKQNVIVADIQASELWKSSWELANQYGLRSCWSYPIFSSHNQGLATFAIYHSEVKEPSEEELMVMERTVNILRVIIENKQSEEKIKISNERYLLATMATNDAIWDADLVTNTIYWGEGFNTLFGYKAGYFSDFGGVWESYIHPQDKARVIESITRFIESNSQHVWEDEYRFRKLDGKYVLVSDRGFLIYNQQGKVNRMVGSMQDITEKREMEKKLLRQQLNRQKLVAQAVVDAQEKERSLIGKELHDNVNQILSTAKLYLEVAKNDDNERDSLIDRSTKNISDAINEIRAISRSLVPSSIGDLGLVESIQDLVESIKLTRKLDVEFYHHDKIDEIISEPQKLMLFRITQEQVNNVIKHANAKKLVIELTADEEAVNISLSDDGKGFDPEQAKHNKGVGLFNITSRAELFNGKVDIITSPGKGCTIHIHVPISSNL